MRTLCEATGLRIKELLKEKEMTQYRLEQNSGVQHGTVNKIVKGINKSVDFMTIIKLAGGFEMSLIDFVDTELFDEENLIVT